VYLVFARLTFLHSLASLAFYSCRPGCKAVQHLSAGCIVSMWPVLQDEDLDGIRLYGRDGNERLRDRVCAYCMQWVSTVDRTSARGRSGVRTGLPHCHWSPTATPSKPQAVKLTGCLAGSCGLAARLTLAHTAIAMGIEGRGIGRRGR